MDGAWFRGVVAISAKERRVGELGQKCGVNGPRKMQSYLHW